MATMLEPHTPAKGWATRWSVQASELLLRVFPSFLCVVVLAHLVFGYAVVGVLRSDVPPEWLEYVLTAIATVVFPAYLFWITHALMRADGHRPAMPLASLESVRGIARFAAVEVGFALARMARRSLVPDVVPAASAAPPGASGLVEAVSWMFGSAMSSLLLTVMVVGCLWPAVFVSTGTRVGTFYFTVLPRMIARNPMVTVTTALVTVVGSVLPVVSMPFWITHLVHAFLLAWLYVGAREVFGGVSENGRKEAKAAAAPAPSAA